MANLGSLFYSLYLKDMTDADISKIKAKLEEKLNIKIGVDVSEKAVDEVLNKLREKGKEITKNSVVQQAADRAEQTSRDIILKQLEREGRMWSDIQAKKEKAMQPVNQALSYSRTQSAISLPYESASYQNAQNQLRAYYQEQERMAKSAHAADNRRINDLVRITSAIQRADNAMQRLSLNSKIGGIAGPKTEQGIEQLRQYIHMLERAKSSSAGMTNALNSIRSGNLTAVINQANRLATEQGKLNAEKNRALALETRHKAALDKTNASLKSQDGIVRSLQGQIANMYSIYTLERFATQLIEIGGEFQKQHIALQSILGDGAKADAMFSKIKNLAIESPFTFQQLAGYTKQLAAFQIPYEELYDTTKRLADVSAGLGVDMGRIILAYGQVRSAAFLRGQEVRQFTEAGIPLLDELAKKFSQLENRVVSVGEVFDKISNREVPFEMVKEVFTDLTNEGGKFYNMQAKLSDSLSGKLAKLKDAYQIMLADIAQANNSLLGGSIDMVRILTEHWRELLPVLTGVIGAYGAYRTAILLVNTALAIQQMQAYYTFLNKGKNVTKAAAVAQWALNSAMSANPYTIAAVAIGALIGGLLYLANAETTAEKAVRLHREEQERFNNVLDERKSKIDRLIRVIQDETETEYAQISAYEQLKSLSPALTNAYTREELAVASLTEANKKLNEERDKLTYEHIISEIDRVKKAMGEYMHPKGISGITLSEYQSYQEELGLLNKQLEEYISLKKQAEENAKPVEIRLIEAKSSREQILQEFNAAKLVLEKEQEKLKKSAFYVIPIDVQIRFNNAQSALKDINNKIASLLSGGSITVKNKSYWEGIKKDAEEARDALDVSLVGSERWNKLTKTIKNAQREIEKFSDKERNKDYIAELWKNRIDLIDKALSSYKEWSKLEGKDAAANRVKSNKEFGGLFTGAYGFKLDLENPNNVWKYIQGQLGNTEKQKELSLSVGVKLDKNEQENLKKEVDNILKNIQKSIDDTTRKWDLFKSIREKTGNKKFAMQLAFGELNVGETDMLKGFREEIEKGIEGKGISFEDVLKMDEASMKDAGISSIEPYVKAYNDGMMQLRKDTADNLAELVSKYRDYATQVTEIENKLNDDLSEIENNRHKFESSGVDVDKMIAERKKQADEEIGSVAFEQFKESSDWVSIFDDLDRVSNATLDDMIDKVEKFAASQKFSVEETKELVEALRKLRSEQTERNPFRALGESFTNIKNARNALKNAKTDAEKESANNQLKAAEAEQADAIQGVISKFDALADAADFLGGVFENLGLGSGLSDAAGVMGSAVGGASTMQGITSALGAAGPWGAAAGAALGLISGIAQIHDKKLDKAIERSKQRVEDLKAAYDNLNDSVERFGGTGTRAVEQQLALYEQLNEQVQRSGSSLSTSYSTVYEVLKNSGRYAEHLKEQIKEGELTAQKISKFFGTNIKLFSVEADKEVLKALEDVGIGGTDALQAYQAQYISLVAQRRELEGQLRDEESKKKSDSGKIADYQQQINELNGQIRYFIEDLAKELYAIDFDGWAGQLSDALVNAFANGEDAAEAFDKAVNNIMKDVANSILKNMVIAPMMEKLQKKLFGDENGKGGVFENFEDLNNNTELAASTIKNFFDTEGNAMLEASDKFLEAFNKATGGALTATGDGGTSGLSKDIQGVTEDTSYLLGSYLNAIRQDVSVKRMLQEKFFNEEFPKMSVIAQAQLQQLNAIARNTERNAQFAEEIRDIINRCYDRGERAFRVH